MEEREQERQREVEREHGADNDTGNNDGAPDRGGRNVTDNGGSNVNGGETEDMEIDTRPAGEVNVSAKRLEAFSAALGKYWHAQHVEQMSIADIEGVVNSGAAVAYSASEIMSLFEMMHEKGSLMIFKDTNVVYFM